MSDLLTLLCMGYMAGFSIFCLHVSQRALTTGSIVSLLPVQTFCKTKQPIRFWIHWTCWVWLSAAALFALAARLVFS